MPTRFGDFVFDEDTRELLRGGEPVPLPPKSFELLRHLLRRRPHAIAKDELHALIWPDTNVTEASLASAASDLRAALNDRRRRPQFIRTVHGFGYAFCGEAQEVGEAAGAAPSASVYRLIWKRREIELGKGENLLGRDRRSVAWFDSPTVSRRHARIVVSGDQALLEDLGSRNGTWIGGKKVTGPVRLSDLDEVKLGSLVMVFRILEASETESGSGS
ncbi:MAG TPA: FHA domain-containing protein [Vicinamibacteria bacterium]